ncbi:hypothetical protein BEL04_15335 [Mucilaginibacter sp. PPCGB 2223]|uniref:DUF5686 and carboxypeptidase regulatory-like domain-containing protein n=1 Tax=Mucilaginibacter sp. PPCGB 2223 TaxID=1886027 RepID=UPI0008258215|nr:DUF5686 and carboxypeptidase regulatory-like domain-containing protein [Mucilaginibacter sp. PPCGB 2223]OCX51400.1 hypothetical protein BEL04_15335 [Mucilaginibacter sp. PPCGB 2223]
MKNNLLLLFALIMTIQVSAQQVVLTGKVTSALGDPVAFASVYVKGTTQGTAGNTEGIYQLKLNPGKYHLIYRAIGYKQLTEDIEISTNTPGHAVQLQKEDYQLKPGDNGDKAYDIIRKAIGKRAAYLAETKGYSCNVYIRGTQKLISAPKSLLTPAVATQLMLGPDGKGILYLSESQSQFNYDGPHRYKEIMVSSKAAGNNNAFNFNRAADLQVNFYKNIFDIEGLNPRGFISPIADRALNYYDYKLLGTVIESGHLIYKIQVLPKLVHGATFAGNIYITDGDWRIYNAHLYVTKKAGINLVDTLNIDQQYMNLQGDVWQPASVAFTFSGNVFGFRFDGYILGCYTDYNLDPKFPDNFFNGEVVHIDEQTARRDSAYWSQNRPVPLSPEEARNYKLRDAIAQQHETPKYLDSLQREKNKFNPVGYVFFVDSVVNFRRKTSLSFPPLYETVFYNTVEGWGINFKPAYNKQFEYGRQYSIAPNLRYGFANKLLNANISASYAYDALNRAMVYGSFGSDILDINSESSVSQFSNTISTLFFKSNALKLYRSRYLRIGLQRDMARGLLFDGQIEYAKRNALVNNTVFAFQNSTFTSNNPVTPLTDYPILFTENNAVTLKVSATYNFMQEYTTTPAGRFDAPSKYPQIKITYRKGIKSVLGSDVDYDYGEIEVIQDRVKTGVYGYTSYMFKAGNFFNNTALIYPDYKQFKGNQGLTFTPVIGSFHFLPYYTYNSTSFLEGHIEHNFSGYFFNRIAGLRVLKLEEIIGANYLTQPGDNHNYTEFYVGMQRFFFRLDYGVSYQGPTKYQQGIRIYYGF